MIRTISVAVIALLAAAPALAAEPDGLILPPGFHASVVADGLGPIRHMALRGNDIYLSTRHGATAPSVGIVALRLGPDHKVLQTEHFGVGTADQGTGIHIYKGALYAASGTGIYRFALDDALVPTAAPELIVDGLAPTNHPLAFDGRGNLYVSVDGGGGANNCPDPKTPKDAKPVGLKPCPLLETRGGVWRFDDSKPGQKFAEGDHFATGIRNSSAMDWHAGDGLYAAWHGRDGTNKGWPELVTAAEDDAIADEMFRITKGTDMGWPYTYWDGVRKIRLGGPEYGGDGKTPVTDSKYAVPVAAFAPLRPAALDMAFYTGSRFPRHAWRRRRWRHRGRRPWRLQCDVRALHRPQGGNAGRVRRRLCRPHGGGQAGQDRGLPPGGRGGRAGRRAVCGRFQQGPDLAHFLRRNRELRAFRPALALQRGVRISSFPLLRGKP